MSVRNTVCYIFNRGISWLPGLSQHLYLVFSGPADANVVDELLYADNLEDELNDIYAQSGTGISVVIVGVIRLTGYNPGSDFIESQTTAGWLAQTSALRDLYNADISYMLNTSGGGRVNMVYADAARAFGVGGWHDTRITAHEIGHIFGCRHQRLSYQDPPHNITGASCINTDPGAFPAPYGHAYYDLSAGGSCCQWRTLMSQCGGIVLATGSPAPWISRFSNPRLSWGGETIGTVANEDCARVHEERISGVLDPSGYGAVRDFRTTPADMIINADNIASLESRRAFATNSISITGTFTVSQNARFTALIGAPTIGLPKTREQQQFFLLADNQNINVAASRVGNNVIILNYTAPSECLAKIDLFSISGRHVASWSVPLSSGVHAQILNTNKPMSQGTMVMRVRAGNLDNSIKVRS